MILPDFMIREMALIEGMIEPFDEGDNNAGRISSGVSSYGYDIRLGNEFKVFNPVEINQEHPYLNSKWWRDGPIIDPKQNDWHKFFTPVIGESCLIPPNSFALGESVEFFKLPIHILGICLGKSTYARCGVIVNITPIEPGFCGKITIEISNTTPLPVRIHAHEGIAQIVFFCGSKVPELPYCRKGGKYQNQKGLTLPVV